ncbi:cysteine desulfurase family protein [Mucilaginibacter myungsuensis]|uniref:cysteine desulfurase n=1 Tax=Mucilaginibacter myungsuensis TaxID=649104 RepID=A0A929PY86_9SPHI|nr:cysteine desulfurase family protein [Mucilaginibacter myungsuensis]MBE9663919.1 cysteine desulfurase [Mucilaginibacter myungsuensis]MDN3598365.1 cysteine desulfurase family protein [Mucilaginibacter myungsuensis]
MKVYLDNAATTPLDKEVFEAMTPYLLQHFGNPSSHHQHGREAKQAIENSRKAIAQLINASPDEIIFTSGGTEADNTAVLAAVRGSGIHHVITTRFEHHAVLHLLEELERSGEIFVSYIANDADGNLDLADLEHLLQTSQRSLVSVMHANNEVGNLNDIGRIGNICEKYNALFHTDTVQTMGHYRHDLRKLKVHFLTASAHKFHGPKGIGFLYTRKGLKLSKLIHGGGQEGRSRAGTENIPGIIGLTKALQLAYADMDAHQKHIQKLKDQLIGKLTEILPDVSFNGNSAIAQKSLYTVLSINVPALNLDLLRCLDGYEISVSGGSACSSGASSHVLQALGVAPGRDTIRFSFSKFNTKQELDYVANKLAGIYQLIAA